MKDKLCISLNNFVFEDTKILYSAIHLFSLQYYRLLAEG
jgi:hypothetical protein